MSLNASPAGAPTLIVVLAQEHHDSFVVSAAPPEDLGATLARFDASLRPLVASRPAPVLALENPSHTPVERFYKIEAAGDRLEAIREAVAQAPGVEAAYLKPPARPASRAPHRQPKTQPRQTPRVPTPDLGTRQGYLDAAPRGVDARYAWTKSGGDGTGVRIVDCEWSWNLQHEDLAGQCPDGVIVGAVDPRDHDDRHGTCVLGVLLAANNGVGVTGVAHGARGACAAFDWDDSDQDTAGVIARVADALSAGDILLLEIHRPGPAAPPVVSGGPATEEGYIPIEWWPDDFAAIRYATDKGLIVVEPAGNGTQNLDAPNYDTASVGFPLSWRNPFANGGPDSGAVMVGAGMPEPGTHGRSHDEVWGFGEAYVDRARCVWSNYGARVDCQGWGYEVTTLSFGDLFEGGAVADHNRLYTDTFAGTSSASPIVAGVTACVQGALKGARRPPASSTDLRMWLRSTGSPQQDGPERPATERIGTRPDLKALLDLALSADRDVPPGSTALLR